MTPKFIKAKDAKRGMLMRGDLHVPTMEWGPITDITLYENRGVVYISTERGGMPVHLESYVLVGIPE